jgi:hypothetical protein
MSRAINTITAATAVDGATNLNIDSGTLFVDTTNNMVGVGTASPSAKLNVYDASSAIALVQGDTNAQIIVNRASADGSAPNLVFRKARGSVASPTAVASADALGVLNFQGFGGTNNRNLARISGNVETYVSDGDISANLIFLTSPAGGVTPTEKMRITAAGDVGIGTASPSGRLHVVAATNTNFYTSSGTTQYQLNSILNGNNANLYYGVEGSSTGRTDVGGTLDNASFFGSRTAHSVQLISNNAARMTIDSSGNLLVGKTSLSTSTIGFQFDLPNQKIASGANGGATAFFNRNGDNGTVVQIARDGAEKGGISVTTTAVAYNTTSDYRLKTNLEPISSGINRIKQLPVYRFNWIADESGNKVDGFVAHEAKVIVPECVTGEKDAVDADGNPVYQGIDQSKIVPLLTAALKEAITKIEVLESKVAALEAA